MINHKFFFTVLLSAFFVYSGNLIASMKCFGTEPYWSINLKTNKAYFKDITEKKVTYKILATKNASGLKPGIVEVYDLAIKNVIDSKAIIKKQNCSDDMSDNTYPYEIILIRPGEVLYGCCN